MLILAKSNTWLPIQNFHALVPPSPLTITFSDPSLLFWVIYSVSASVLVPSNSLTDNVYKIMYSGFCAVDTCPPGTQ